MIQKDIIIGQNKQTYCILYYENYKKHYKQVLLILKNYSCYEILEEDIVVNLKSEQMRLEEIRSEHGARSTELHGCYRRLLLKQALLMSTMRVLFFSEQYF